MLKILLAFVLAAHISVVSYDQRFATFLSTDNLRLLFLLLQVLDESL